MQNNKKDSSKDCASISDFQLSILRFRQGLCIDISSIILATILTVCTIIGSLLLAYGRLYPPSTTIVTVIFITLLSTVVIVFYYLLIQLYFNKLQKIGKNSYPHLIKDRNVLSVWAKRFGILCICWMPYLMLSLPGTVHGDYVVQLLQHFGNRPLDNHHPILTTLLYGTMFDIGKTLFSSYSGGVLFTAITQAVLLSSSIAFAITQLEERGAKRSLCVGAMTFFAMLPVFPLYAFDCIKDTLACSALIVFFTQICSRSMCALNDKPCPWWVSVPAIACVSVLCSVLRNNYSYCVVPTLFMLVLKKENWRTALLSCVAVACTLFVWSSISTNVLGVKKGNIREMLSVPMQQIAYCLTNHTDDITKEEGDTLQQLLSVDIDEIPSRYTYKISDPVKSVFNIESRQQMMDFIKVWVNIGIRHPRSYLTSFLRGNYGYWYPFLPFDDIKWGNPLAISPEDYIASLHDQLKMDFSGDAEGLLSIRAINKPLRDSLRDSVNTIAKTPPTSILFEPATYVWFALLTTAWSARKKKCWAEFVLVFVLFLTCCASPDFSNVRYAFPFYALAPISLLSASLACAQQDIQHQEAREISR